MPPVRLTVGSRSTTATLATRVVRPPYGGWDEGHGFPASWPGMPLFPSLLACVVDEIAFFGLSEESKVKNDSELIRALRPSLATTGGPLIAVGSPYAAKGYAYSTWKRSFGNDSSDVLVWNAPSTEINPGARD